MNEKIVLIDGHSILNRAFYGLPDLTNAEGLHTNAIYGFLTIMFKILEEEKPEYLTVAFDVHAPTFRHEMYDAYKGTRKPMADELRQQVPVIKEVLGAMGIKTIEQAGLEADDLLGTISRRGEERGMEVSVISGDRDLLQLATEHVKIRIPKTKQGRTEVEDYYSEDVKNRYQVTPLEFIDLKALMGDTSDNIPGVPSIGEKTATKIITEYHSIENAYAHVEELKPPRASKALKEHWDLAVMSKTLATIEVHADFSYDFEEARLGNIYTEEAYAYFQRLQFKNLLSKFDVTAPANSVEDHFRVIESKTEAMEIFRKAAQADCVGAAIFKDLENVLPLFVQEAGVGGVALSFSQEDILCIRCNAELSGEWLLNELEMIAEKADRFVVFDLKAQMEFLKLQRKDNCFDATVAAYLLNPLKSDYTYEDVAREQLDLILEDKTDLTTKACYEAYTAYASSTKLEKRLKEDGLWSLFEEIEMPLVFTLYDMEKNGVKVEAEALKHYGDQLGDKIVELEKEIYEDANETFNINSPKQLGVVLFENMKIPGGRKTKTGYSTAAEVLENLAPAKYIEDYFHTYPGIKAFLDDAVAHAKENGYVKTLFGRRRPVPELASSNFMQRSFGERVAMNAPIQGTAADIMKIAMIGVNKRLKEQKMKSRLVLQVHDELLIETHHTEIDTVKEVLREEMEQAAVLAVPLEIDMHTGNNWYEAK